MRCHLLPILALTLSTFALVGAGPDDAPSRAPAMARADVMSRLTAQIHVDMNGGVVPSIFRRVEGPNLELCRVESRTEAGFTRHTQWFHYTSGLWVSAQRRGDPRDLHWYVQRAYFDARGRMTRHTTQEVHGRHATAPQEVRRAEWYDEGPVLARTWYGPGYHEEFRFDEARPHVVRVFARWDDAPLAEKYTWEFDGDDAHLRVVGLPDVLTTITRRADGSLFYIHAQGQAPPLTADYDRRGAMTRGGGLDIQVDERGRPTVFTYTEGVKESRHLFYGCAWPEGAPDPLRPSASPGAPAQRP